MTALVLLQAANGAGAPPDLPSGYGAALVQTLAALVGVCLLAWVVLRWLARRGFGGALPHGLRARGTIRVLDRAPLGPRRELYIVRAGGKTLLLGTSDGAPTTLLAELPEGSVPEAPETGSGSAFSRLLHREAPGGKAGPS